MDKSTTLYNELKLIASATLKPSQRPTIRSSAETYQYLLGIWPGCIEVQEQVVVIYLNNKSSVVGWQHLGRGAIDSCTIDVRLVLSTALLCSATRIILAHNHPSGNMMPSKADLNITKKMMAAAGVMDIMVLDHLIISSEGYRSMADEGEL